MKEEKAQRLLHVAKLILERDVIGARINASLLEQLRDAVADVERMKHCGHLEDDDCDC